MLPPPEFLMTVVAGVVAFISGLAIGRGERGLSNFSINDMMQEIVARMARDRFRTFETQHLSAVVSEAVSSLLSEPWKSDANSPPPPTTTPPPRPMR